MQTDTVLQADLIARNTHRPMEMFKREYLYTGRSYVGKMPTTALGSQTHSPSALEEVISILGFF